MRASRILYVHRLNRTKKKHIHFKSVWCILVNWFYVLPLCFFCAVANVVLCKCLTLILQVFSHIQLTAKGIDFVSVSIQTIVYFRFLRRQCQWKIKHRAQNRDNDMEKSSQRGTNIHWALKAADESTRSGKKPSANWNGCMLCAIAFSFVWNVVMFSMHILRSKCSKYCPYSVWLSHEIHRILSDEERRIQKLMDSLHTILKSLLIICFFLFLFHLSSSSLSFIISQHSHRHMQQRSSARQLNSMCACALNRELLRLHGNKRMYSLLFFFPICIAIGLSEMERTRVRSHA